MIRFNPMVLGYLITALVTFKKYFKVRNSEYIS